MKKNKYSYSKIYYPTPKRKEGFYISTKSIKFLIIFLLFGSLVYFLFLSSFFNLKNIIIEGEPDENLKTEIYKLKDKNILFIDQSELENKITKEYPINKSIIVYKGLPDSLKISIEKRSRFLIWQTGGKYFSLDDEGIAYEEMDSLPADNQVAVVDDRKNVPTILGQRIVVPEFIIFVKKALDIIPAKAGVKIQNIGVEESTYHLFLKTSDGWQIIMDISKPIEEQNDDLNLILSKYKDQIREYIDLRVSGRVYYK